MARIYEGVPPSSMPFSFSLAKVFFVSETHYSRKRATAYLQSDRKAKYYRILVKRLSAYILSREFHSRSKRDCLSGTPFLSESFERLAFPRKRARIFLRTRQTNVNSRNLALEMHASPPVSLSLIGILSSHKSPLFCFRSFMFCFRPRARHPAALRSFMTF